MFWLGFFIGIVAGGNLGVIVMALFKSHKN
jgi:hypothetical protein